MSSWVATVMSARGPVVRFEARKGAILTFGLLAAFALLRFGWERGAAAAVLLVLSLLIHELAHAAVARITGTRVIAFGACIRGMYIRRLAAHDIRSELMIVLAGPLVNLLLGFTALALVSQFTQMAAWVALVNVTLGISNLLPIKNSDGDRALSCMRELRAAPMKPSATPVGPSVQI